MEESIVRVAVCAFNDSSSFEEMKSSTGKIINFSNKKYENSLGEYRSRCLYDRMHRIEHVHYARLEPQDLTSRVPVEYAAERKKRIVS